MWQRAVLLGLMVSVAGSATAGDIALVDVGEVLKQYDRFAVEMADLKARTNQIAAQFQEKGQALQLLQQEFATKSEGSEEHLQLKAQIERTTAEIKTSMDDLKRRLQREEATLYADAYEEVREAIRRVAVNKGYEIVMRFQSSAEVDRTSTQSILKHLNRGVLYHRDLDITSEVVAQLRRPAKQ